MSTPFSSAESPVRTHLHQGVATLTLNRPQAHNALDDEATTALLTALQTYLNHPEVRVLVIAANGKSFVRAPTLKAAAERPPAKRQTPRRFRPLPKCCNCYGTAPNPWWPRCRGALLAAGLGFWPCAMW